MRNKNSLVRGDGFKWRVAFATLIVGFGGTRWDQVDVTGENKFRAADNFRCRAASHYNGHQSAVAPIA